MIQDIIDKLCVEKGVAISQVEKDLGYGNGSIKKSNRMSGKRVFEIAQYFGVTCEYLMTGKDDSAGDSELTRLKKGNVILKKIADARIQITDYNFMISKLEDEIRLLEEEYAKL